MSPQAVVEPGDFLRVTNLGNKELDARGNPSPYAGDTFVEWDGRRYNLPVAEESVVPFDAIRLACGDPRSGPNISAVRNTEGVAVGFIADRATEIRRLRARYDNQTGGDGALLPHSHPVLDVRDLAGNQVVTVLDDPEGTTTTPANLSVSASDDLYALLHRQEQQIEILKQRLGIDLNTPPDGGEFDLESSEEPTAADAEPTQPDTPAPDTSDTSTLPASDEPPADTAGV